ncbi:MAG: hypothetical protein ACRDLS_06120 [Solirubrobacteraceae bacterium]
MWFGLLYGIPDEPPPEADGGRAIVVLYAWEAGRGRPLTVGCPLSAAPDMARLLREAATGTPIMTPQCDACGAALDLPLD